MTRMLSTLLQQNYGPYGNASSTGTATLPKKPPMSAYQVFVMSEKDSFGRGRKVTEVMKGLGNKWKLMNETQKAPFVTKHQQAKDDYERQLNKMNPTVLENLLGEEREKKIQKKKLQSKRNLSKTIKEQGMPKNGARTPYVMFFSQENKKAQYQGLPVPQRGKLVGEAWKALSEREKQVYVDKWTVENAAAQKALAAWQKANPEASAAIEAARMKRKQALALDRPPKVVTPEKKEKTAASKTATTKAKTAKKTTA